MIDVPRQTLREIVAKYGRTVCEDPKRCRGLLRDFCGSYRREINVLVGALEERVGVELLAVREGRSSMPREVLLSRLTKRLEDNLALTEGAARWAIDSWALALGVLSEAEVKAREREATEVELRKDEARVELLVKKQIENSGSSNSQTQTKIKEEPDALPEQPDVRIIASPPPTEPPVVVAPRQAAPVSTKKSSQPPTPVPVDPPRRRRRGKFRSCVLGCLLIIVLTALAIFGTFVVVPLLRDEQQQQAPTQPPQTTR
ncbi:MAG: hypothetical protein H0V88_11955 [Pyrinomonadaceae bacterium]|nr:hypothetical protein [Pyrinomonadaceae bacterium]